MAADKKSRIMRIMGFICLTMALFNVTIAVLAMIEEKSVRKGGAGIAIGGSLLAIGMLNLTLSKRRQPPGN